MLDSYNRKISYLRISVTDRCNLRCVYCMPSEGITLKKHVDILSYTEIIEVVKIAATMGITKIRITGGEPLVRKDIHELIDGISTIPQIRDIALTTNGILLEQYAQMLKNSGLHRVNISLDTLNPIKYAEITRGGDISRVFEGIQAAKEAALFPIKINSVVFDPKDDKTKGDLKAFAESNNLEIRFISQMNLHTGEFSVVDGGSGGDCRICNRLRLTSDGFLKPCLFSEVGFNIRQLGIEEALFKAIQHKPEKGMLCNTHEFYNIGG